MKALRVFRPAALVLPPTIGAFVHHNLDATFITNRIYSFFHQTFEYFSPLPQAPLNDEDSYAKYIGMTGSEIIMEVLKERGVSQVFG